MLVDFLRGKQDKLPASGATNGTFYLTEDTKRLYICLEDNGVPQLLNQTVQIVTDVSSLPDPDKGASVAINDFYYCLQENILAVYTSISVEENGQTITKNQWVQINPDTGATDIEITGSGNTITSVSYDASTRKLTFTKGETFATANELNNFKTYVGTYPADEDKEGNPKYANAIDYVIQVATGGSSESAASVKQQLDTYKETNDAAVAEAQSTANTAKENAATAQETANEAKQAAANAVTTAATDATSKADAAKSGAISESKQYTNTQLTAVNNRLGDIEDTINSINPMSYKGIINSEKPLSSLTSVSVGDTYMVAEAGLYEGESAKVGDLFIATLGDGATEENNIISGTIEWTYIPSGDETDTDTQYLLINEGSDIVLKNTTANNVAGKVSLKEGQNISIEATDPEAPTEIMISHESIKTNVENSEYDVIADLGCSNGHITSILGKQIISDNLTITKSDTAIKINLEWGTF